MSCMHKICTTIKLISLYEFLLFQEVIIIAYLKKYILIYSAVLGVSCSLQDLRSSYSMWGLSAACELLVVHSGSTGMEPGPPALGV